MVASPAAFIAAVAVGSLITGFGAGWVVNDWRNSAEITRLESVNAVVTAANDRCALAVRSAQNSVDEIKSAAAARAVEAEEAMRGAQAQANRYKAAARAIQRAAIPSDETACETVGREQVEYIAGRRGESDE